MIVSSINRTFVSKNNLQQNQKINSNKNTTFCSYIYKSAGLIDPENENEGWQLRGAMSAILLIAFMAAIGSVVKKIHDVKNARPLVDKIAQARADSIGNVLEAKDTFKAFKK